MFRLDAYIPQSLNSTIPFFCLYGVVCERAASQAFRSRGDWTEIQEFDYAWGAPSLMRKLKAAAGDTVQLPG
jgi:hypothetical protein